MLLLIINNIPVRKQLGQPFGNGQYPPRKDLSNNNDSLEQQNQQLSKTFFALMKRYRQAKRRWKKAGKPLRPPEVIADIYDNVCSKCEHFDDDSCGICGCRLKREGTKWNKLSWATERCPDNPPRWMEALPQSQIQKLGGCGCGK